ncbi:MAG: VOC family protein [Phycisphaerae bacterium]
MSAVSPIPERFHTITPHLCIRGAADAIEFYKKAFGAEEIFRMPGPDGKSIGHAELQIGDSVIMMGDEIPQMEGWRSPSSFNGTTVALCLYVEDVDKSFQRALDAGAKVSMPVTDMFWGDRYGKVTDPFGHEWAIATHKQDLTPEEIAKGAEAFFASMGGCQ